MAIPPFPSQDLAKLVLGYLAEEQLMTAYDEFLQASPYLDAMRNEYDRIFMTSLKNILAEYRAVRIYVETCKPFLLRKKLFQCVNLLEIVKFLVNNIDVDKLYAQDFGDKSSLEKHNVSFRAVGCDVCNSLKLTNCVCKENQCKQTTGNDGSPYLQQSCLQSSIETTSLDDLPGNHSTITKRKQAKTLKKKPKHSVQSCANNVQNDHSKPLTTGRISNCSAQQFVPIKNTPTSNLNVEKTFCNSYVQPKCIVGSIQRISECSNTNLDKNNLPINNKSNSLPESKVVPSPFQNFASGVRAGCETGSVTVPDSSTSDNINFQTPINNIGSCRAETQQQIVLKIEPTNRKLPPPPSASISAINASHSHMHSKPNEQKIKILSDVKVDNTNQNERKLIVTSRNATSTPLMKMQTIVINGTPAYRSNPVNFHPQNFTKDEIMAMPTIIVVPATGPSQLANIQTDQQSVQSFDNGTVQSNPPNKILSPLVIDVSPSNTEGNDKNKELAQLPVTAGDDVGLIKTVDNIVQQKMTSLPKNSNTTCTVETNTPLVMPPLRKSSSTPRRTSHVRVLDFTTPRRILQETIMEQGALQINNKPVDVVVSKSNNIILSDKVDLSKNDNNMQKPGVHKLVTIPINDSPNIVLSNKKTNWDHDLRAMVTNNDETKSSSKSTRRKIKSTKKGTDKGNKKKDKKYVSDKKLKGRQTKKKQILKEDDEVIELPTKPDSVPIKPTINIKPAVEWEPTSASSNKKDLEAKQIDKTNQSQENEQNDTPEAERLVLQNVIGSKLNISDLLETPYKQVFYDIQMETPRCLGPDMPDEPMSDIKIMNIPTPRFFNSPKIIQATPSSYSSRPTDYSSSGSYYKPDDQDFLPLPDIKCPVTSSKLELHTELLKDENKKTTRPVRQCAKNVSYYSSNRAKDCEDKTDVASSCSETTNGNSSLENKPPKEKTYKGNTPNESTKVERSKKSVRKKKSPTAKEKPKTFMKIKPRRVTPTKENLSGRPRKKTSSNSPKLQRKRTTSQEKNLNVNPTITSIPTKSRRKSSTPRKLHCSKTFNSESSGHDSPETSTQNKQQNTTRDTNSIHTQDSDTEQLNLRWSDDGSQDGKINELHKNVSESEDISKIQEYIQTTVAADPIKETNNALQTPLVKKGFDEVTAKIIERDLMYTPPRNEFITVVQLQDTEPKQHTKDETTFDQTIETDTSVTSELQIVQDNTEDIDEVELSIHETNEESDNWRCLMFNDDDGEAACKNLSATLKDTFSMEVCIEDGIAIRLRAAPFNSLFEQEPAEDDHPYSYTEIEDAVKSISNIDKLYTPLKDSIKAQCYEIFDSTLTSLDTPLKVTSPKNSEREITENIMEDEKAESKDKAESKKRKRLQNSNEFDESSNESKKAKPDTQYLLATANIQNIDIESVLKKLHGP